jgi:hypothetical protein
LRVCEPADNKSAGRGPKFEFLCRPVSETFANITAANRSKILFQRSFLSTYFRVSGSASSPQMFYSTGQFMTLRFITDASVVDTGFYGAYSTVFGTTSENLTSVIMHKTVIIPARPLTPTTRTAVGK